MKKTKPVFRNTIFHYDNFMAIKQCICLVASSGNAVKWGLTAMNIMSQGK